MTCSANELRSPQCSDCNGCESSFHATGSSVKLQHRHFCTVVVVRAQVLRETWFFVWFGAAIRQKRKKVVLNKFALSWHNWLTFLLITFTISRFYIITSFFNTRRYFCPPLIRFVLLSRHFAYPYRLALKNLDKETSKMAQSAFTSRCCSDVSELECMWKDKLTSPTHSPCPLHW